MDWLATIWAKLWDPVATPAAVGVTAVGGYLIRRFRERMVTLRWSLSHQSVAITASDDVFGKVEILHNSIPVQNLSMCYIEIENESSKDLTDLSFAVSYADGTTFLMSVASLRTGEQLLLTNDWTNTMNTWAALPDAQKPASPLANYLLKTREYRVQVLNRREKVNFVALVQVPPGVTPVAAVSCVHLGVRVRHRAASPMFLGVNQQRATLLGFVLGLAAVFLLTWSPVNATRPILLAYLMGTMVMLIGAGVIHLARLIGRILG